MNNYKKPKDEFTKKDSKRIEKKSIKSKRKKLNPKTARPPKYRNLYLNEEE